MKKIIPSVLAAAAVALATVAVPSASYAAPLSVYHVVVPEAASDVIKVQRTERRGNRQRPPREGHRNRRGNNVAPLIGGLAAGALLLGAIEAERARERERDRRYREREVYYDDDDHIAWCLDRYRSYDIRSDSYQPFDGPRRRCISPYS